MIWLVFGMFWLGALVGATIMAALAVSSNTDDMMDLRSTAWDQGYFAGMQDADQATEHDA